jgi:hypothetical protein
MTSSTPDVNVGFCGSCEADAALTTAGAGGNGLAARAIVKMDAEATI